MIKNMLNKLLGLLGVGKPQVRYQPMVMELRLIPPPPPPTDEPRMTNIWGPPDDGSCQFVGRNPLTNQVVRCPGPGHARIFKKTVQDDGEMETIVTCAMHAPLVLNGEDPEMIKFDILVDNI